MVDPVYYLDYIDSVKSNLPHGPANSMCIVKIVFNTYEVSWKIYFPGCSL